MMRARALTWLAALVTIALWSCNSVLAQEESILVQSTTSTANSGLYDFILPEFEQASGIRVNIVAVGTGQAIKNARNCDADILLVHARPAEEKFVADGYGVSRHALMYNDFIIVGPPSDPAGIAGSDDAVASLAEIAQTQSLFASRGDDSGTHKMEQALWKRTDIDLESASGSWYRSTGSGMGATLNTGIGMGAYVLTDRATWISFANKGDYSVAVESDPAMFNQYGVILVNPEKCPTVKETAGQAFIDWLVSQQGQELIGSFQIDGQQLFIPNAGSAD
jgi:tungstate transport system substrate-binding protein